MKRLLLLILLLSKVYGQIDLATQTKGTTAGAVLFGAITPTGGVAMDGSTFYWDNVNKRLRLINTAPASPHDTARVYLEHASTAASSIGLDISFTTNTTGAETNFNRAIDLNLLDPVNASRAAGFHGININGFISNGQNREYAGIVSGITMLNGTAAGNTAFNYDANCQINSGQPKGNCFGYEAVITNNSGDNNPARFLGGLRIIAAGGVLDRGIHFGVTAGSWRRGIDADDVTSFSDDFIYAPTRQLSWNADLLLKKTLYMNFANASQEVGSVSVANTPTIDLHSSGNNIDYDTRISSTGGTGSSGNGTLSVEAAQVNINAVLTLKPVTNASLGTPGNGSLSYCSDCTIANPCAGGGTGALAKRLNGIWVCN